MTDVPLQISTTRLPDHARVELAGDLDLATAPVLASHLRTLVRDHVREIVIDLGSLEFIDSSGITEIVRAAGEAATLGGHVEVCNAAGSSRRVIDICGLARVPGISVR